MMDTAERMRSVVGAVAIGRNEGERLRQCLQSLVGPVAAVVYVDSGSTDDSVAMARSMGVEVVELDLATPFTAATTGFSIWSIYRSNSEQSRAYCSDAL